MRALRDLVRAAHRRLRWQRWLDVITPGALAGAVVSTGALLAARALGASFAWPAMAIGMASAVAVAAAIARARPSPSERTAAIEIDARLALEGRIASALALTGRPDPFARAAVEDGERAALDPAIRPRVRRAFRIVMPARSGWVLAAWGAFAVCAWLVPTRARGTVDAAAVDAGEAPAAVLARVADAESRVEQAVRTLAENPEAQDRLREMLQDFAEARPVPGDGGEGEARDATAREAEALRRAAALEDRIGRELESPDLAASEDLRDMLAALPPVQGVDPALMEALKTGRLEAAAEALERLAKDAAGADAKKAAQARQSLDALAKAIEQSGADGSKSLADALERAGLDPGLAKDPAAAQRAIEQAAKSGALSKEQSQSLQKQAEARRQAGERTQQLAKSVKECRNGSSASARRELSRQQSAQRMQATLQMAMRQCDNPGAAGWSMPWTRSKSSSAGGGGKGGGKGSGKPGQGGAPDTDGNTEAIPDGKLAAKQESAGDGDPLDQAAARDFIRAEGLPTGTASSQLQAVAAKVAAGLEEGTEEDPVPGRLKQAHKRYFEQWKRRLDEKGASPPVAP